MNPEFGRAYRGAILAVAAAFLAVLGCILVWRMYVWAPSDDSSSVDVVSTRPRANRLPTLNQPRTQTRASEQRITSSQIAGPGTIEGVVFTIKGIPTPAEIVLQKASSMSKVSLTRKEDVRHTTCDAYGWFRVTELSHGTYTVTGRFEDAYAVERVVLRPNEDFARVTLVLFPGRPVAGTVVNEFEEPVGGARLTPATHDGKNTGADVGEALTVHSQEDGSFLFAALEPHMWELYVSAPGYAPVLTPPMQAGSTDNRIVLREGHVVSGSVVRVSDNSPIGGLAVTAAPALLPVRPVTARTDAKGRFELGPLDEGHYVVDVQSETLVVKGGPVALAIRSREPAPTLKLQVEDGGVLLGRVIDGLTKEGIAGVRLRARPKDKLAKYVEASPSEDDGAFEFTGLAAGEYTISAVGARGYSRGREHAIEVSIAPGEVVDNVEMVLLSGVVVAGVVVDDSDTPAPGAEVRVFAERGGALVQAFTDTKGAFVIGGLEPESALVLSAHTPFASSEELEVVRPPESGATGIKLILSVPTGASISGIVVDRQGRPVKAELFVAGEGRTNHPLKPVTTTADGEFLVTGIEPGNYTVHAKRGAGTFVELGSVRAVVDEPAPYQRLVFPMDTFEIVGTVLNSFGDPVSASLDVAEVRENHVLASGFAQSRHDGSFQIAGVEEGIYQIRAIAKGYEPQTVRAYAGDRDVVISLVESGKLAGQVVNANTKQPITAFEIAAVRGGTLPAGGIPNAKQFQVVSNPEGRFSLALEEYYYDLFVRAPGYQLARAAASTSPELDRSGLIVELTPGDVRVAGRVVDAFGNGVSGAAIFIGQLPQFAAQFASRAVTWSDNGGVYEISGLSEGDITISAFHPAAGVGSITLTAGPSANMRFDITLQAGATLQGIVHSEGTPIPYASVSIFGEGGETYRAVTNTDGFYSIPNVGVGSFRFTVEVPSIDGAQNQQASNGLTISGTGEWNFDFDVAENMCDK